MRHLLTPLLGSLVLFSACGELPTETPLSAPDAPQLARQSGYPVVQVKAGLPDQPGNAGAPVVNNLAAAVDRVADGGTIRVHPGEYAAEDIVISKTVTIEAVGGEAVIRNQTAAFALRVVDGGALTVRGLRFENASAAAGSASIRAFGTAVTVEDAVFQVGPDGFAAVYAGGGAGSLRVGNATVSGGGYGLIGVVPTVEVTGSTLSGQRWVSLYYTGNGTIAGNTMTDCGDNACIFAVGGATGVITGNGLSNGRTGPGPVDEWPYTGGGIPAWAFTHHVILVFTGADVAITDNEIDGCGWGQCITTGRGGHALIENNRITAYQSQGTRIGIVAGDGAGGASGDPAAAGSAVVRNNQLIGVADAIADRTDLDEYAFRLAALQAEGVGSALHAAGNLVTNAARGLVARAGAEVTGSGNRAELLATGTAIWDAGSRMEVHGSDFVDYLLAIDQGGNLGSSLTCNWWGPGGPAAVQLVEEDASLYTPWATAPIAATGQTSGCTGGL